MPLRRIGSDLANLLCRLILPGVIVVTLGATRLNAVGPPVTFAPQQPFATGTHPTSVAEGDFNGDGKLDLVITNQAGATVSVLLNTTATGAATPTFAPQQTFTTGAGPTSVAVGDFNGDGKLDLAVANRADNTVSVLLNTTTPGAATPTFAAQQTFTTGAHPTSVAVGDFNGDGKVDLAIANQTDNTVSVLLNTTVTGAATPTFAAQQTFTTGAGPTSVVVGDFNGDGKLDLAVANQSGNTVSVLLNTTATGAVTPSFAAKTDLATGVFPTGAAVADFNGDGKLDLAIANQTDNTVSVLLNTTTTGAATPSFAAQQTFAAGSGPSALVGGDLDGDGRPDVAVTDATGSTVTVLLNTTLPGAATPSFLGQPTVATGAHPASVVVGDFNGDGTRDLAVANQSDNTASVLLSTTVAGVVTPTFAGQTPFLTGSSPFSVAVGDFNGDGKPDLAVANLNDATASVLLNTTPPGAASPTFAAQQTFATGTSPFSVAVGDFNGDGKPDLAVANFNDATVSVLLNTTPPGAASPTFATQQTFLTGGGPRSVAVGDFNGDGRPDLAVANLGDATVSVLLNTTPPGATTPSFTAEQHFTTGGGSHSVAVGDFNGDGKPDLAVANFNDATVSVLLNTTPPGAASPTFAAQQTFATGPFPFSVAVGNFNGDGKPDLAVANSDDATVSVLLNTTPSGATTPTFAAQQTFATGSLPASVAVGDFNGDGKPDLGIANFSDNTVSVLLNTTTPGAASPTFAAQQILSTGANPRSVAVGDFNGDGRPDIAAANQSGNTVSVLLNQGESGSPPTISKSFGAASTALNGTVSLTFAITNPNGTQPLTGIGFSDTLPAGLVVTTPNGLSGACGGGTITATAGSSAISLGGATLAGSAACSFSVNVTGTTPGIKSNTTGTVTSNEGGTGGTGSATVTVIPTHFSLSAPPTATAGTAFNFTVTAQDQSNTTVTGYTGTVHFTSNDPLAVLPADATLTNGVGIFAATLGTVGTQTLTATDTISLSITGTSDNIVVGALTSFSGASVTGTGNVSAQLAGGGAGCTLASPQFIGPPPGAPPIPPTTPWPGVTFPHGLFDFRATGCGGTITITLTYPQPVTGLVYWKYGPTADNPAPHWYVLPATIAGNTVTFSITDGGLGDDDLAANGTIVDQGGPGSPPPVPTLSEWMLVALASLLLAVGARRLVVACAARRRPPG